MKANPGGQLDLKSVIGRDELVSSLWETLDNQSVVMTAERRIGKTTIIRKMEAEKLDGWRPVFEDLEKHHSAAEFAMGVYRTVNQFLTGKSKIAKRTRDLLAGLGGTEIAGVFRLPEKREAPWKDILTRSIEDLIHENEKNGERLLFLWDELPFMLASIRDREGENTAMEVLDVLRALRMTHSSLRMVFTGSIGLHHVIKSLKAKNYGNSPLNDMLAVEVPPLDKASAIVLASSLLDGESIVVKDSNAVAAAIADFSDNFAFYIHHIVKALKSVDTQISPSDIEPLVRRQYVDAIDPWELSHYRSRIPNYYGDENEKAVLMVLDELATEERFVPLDQLAERIKTVDETLKREDVIDLLELMQKDHYLTRSTEGHYAFQFSLIRAWWKTKRGL